MHIHILGICGTFMGGLAILAKAQGHHVTGSDNNVYPPMSTQLEQQGIRLTEGFDPSQLEPRPDCIVIGNAMRRGNPCIEYILNNNLPMMSGPDWLAHHVLANRWVLGVAGTHGKSTTASMLAWILQYAGMAPGFLIGAVPTNFTASASLGETPFFVIEADEYDSAFFDKRSKFIHYRPRTLVLNNLEFDHADIFTDLASIQRQFHHLVRIVPSEGLIVRPKQDQALDAVISQGCWTPNETLGNGGDWSIANSDNGGSHFSVALRGNVCGEVNWPMLGEFNQLNGLAAIAAARHVGVTPEIACQALSEFKGLKRRLEIIAKCNGITVYDDFAHHPTAIAKTITSLRDKVNRERIIAIVELGSYTMRQGVHQHNLADALKDADKIYIKPASDSQWDVTQLEKQLPDKLAVISDTQVIIDNVLGAAKPSDHILIMSNRGFEGIHKRLVTCLS